MTEWEIKSLKWDKLGMELKIYPNSCARRHEETRKICYIPIFLSRIVNGLMTEYLRLKESAKGSNFQYSPLHRSPFQDTGRAFLSLYPNRTKKTSIWQNSSVSVEK